MSNKQLVRTIVLTLIFSVIGGLVGSFLAPHKPRVSAGQNK